MKMFSSVLTKNVNTFSDPFWSMHTKLHLPKITFSQFVILHSLRAQIFHFHFLKMKFPDGVVFYKDVVDVDLSSNEISSSFLNGTEIIHPPNCILFNTSTKSSSRYSLSHMFIQWKNQSSSFLSNSCSYLHTKSLIEWNRIQSIPQNAWKEATQNQDRNPIPEWKRKNFIFMGVACIMLTCFLPPFPCILLCAVWISYHVCQQIWYSFHYIRSRIHLQRTRHHSVQFQSAKAAIEVSYCFKK